MRGRRMKGKWKGREGEGEGKWNGGEGRGSRDDIKKTSGGMRRKRKKHL